MESDADIIQAVLDGNQRAFEQLVERYQDAVARFIWNVVPSSDDREEVCQDVFVKVYFKLDQFRFDAKFSTWLYRVAYRAAISFNRRQKPASDTLDDIDPAADWDPGIERVELKAVIDQLLDQLKLEERTVVSLYYIQEMSVEEIGLVIDRPSGTVKSILYRVRQKLQKSLARRLPEYLPAQSEDLV